MINPVILSAFGLTGAQITVLGNGLINKTFLAELAAKKVILQSLSPIFSATVFDDIKAVTDFLQEKGQLTTKLMPTNSGSHFYQDPEGTLWRALTYIPGSSHLAAPSAAHCHSAGKLLGHYHALLADLPYSFKHCRPHVHESRYHFAQLAAVIDTPVDNWSKLGVLKELSVKLLDRENELLDFAKFPSAIVHGDPKIANFLFDREEAITMIDLDTFARRSLISEVADALRSFAATGSEEVSATFNETFYNSFVNGYRETNPEFFKQVTTSELRQAIRTICFELAARFAKEAFCPQYFAWNKKLFSSANDHNLYRSLNLINLALSISINL